jgi:hypothetical protein
MKVMRQILFVSGLFCLMCACSRKKDYKEILHDPRLYSSTVHELNRVVMGNNFSPIVASRNYLYACIAGYEAMVAGYPERYHSLEGQLKGLTGLPKPDSSKLVDFEFASLLAFCKLGEAVTFPAGSMSSYVDSLKALAKDHGMPTDEFNNSIAFADTISAAIMAWSKKDNYAQTRSFPKYNVRNDEPGRWVPTPPAYTEAMEPNWRVIRTVVLDSANQFLPPRPPVFNMTDTNSLFYQEAVKIKKAGDSLTEEQRHIANFWDDNPFKLNVSGHVMFGTKKFSPPGHWMSIVGIAAQSANADFPKTVYAYAITAIAQFDAFIHCWDEKFRSNSARPETIINQFLDPEWRPLLQTPPFPEYTCGHSTVSSANAEALTRVFGDNFKYTDTSELEFGIPSRSFNSFRHAAEENNWARFYGGIHFHNSCIISTEYGKKVGQYIVQKLKFEK